MAGKILNPEIDIALTALVLHAKPEQTLDYTQIADVCGCTKATIEQIARRAQRNCRDYLQRSGIGPDILFNDSKGDFNC